MALMDELAARGITSEDLEKAASARLFEQAAAAEGIDLDTLNDSQINELYGVWANGDAGEAKTASAGEIEEAHAKLAEAEILGRHMARMYMDELGKEAASMADLRTPFAHEAKKGVEAAAGAVRHAGQPSLGAVTRKMDKMVTRKAITERGGAGGLFERVKGKLTMAKDKAHEALTGHEAAKARANEYVRHNVHGTAPGGENKARDAREKSERLKGYAKRVGIGGAAASVPVVGKVVHDKMMKESSAEEFDAMALQLAEEILASANGSEKEAAAEDPSFDDALAARALEILEANGYDVSPLLD